MSTNQHDKILLIDDDPDTRFLVRCLLENHCEVEEADNADSGLQAALESPPSLIMLDVNMPGKDGFTACRQFRFTPETAGIPVIFITASSSPGDVVEGFAAGGTDYITKPFDAAELRARVSAQLRLQKINKERADRIGYLSSALQGLEQSYLFFADHTADVIFRCSPDRKIRHVNRQWTVISGLQTGNPIGRFLEELAVEADREIIAASIEEAIEEERESIKLGFSVATAASACPVQASMLFCHDSSGACTEINVIMTDVSEVIAAADLETHSSRCAAKAQIAYLENISHEIRTPLNGVMGAAAALKEIDMLDTAREMITIIETEAERLESLLTAMLASRPATSAPGSADALPAVLAVDDSPTNLKLLVHMLKNLGFSSIEEAASGEEGWEKWQAGKHGLVLLDYRMEGMSGHDLCRLIRSDADGASIRILGVSANAIPENEEEARLAGFDLQIAKPISRVKLTSALQNLGLPFPMKG